MATSEFGKAFAAARKAGDKEFTFNGKKYNTKLASDVDSNPYGAKAGEYKPRDTYTRRGEIATSANYTPRDSYTRSGQKSFDTETENVPSGVDLERGNSRGNRRAYESVKADQEAGSVTPSKVRGLADAFGVPMDRKDEAGNAYKKGGSVKSSASRRGDGIAQRGKTKGRMI